MPKIVTKNEKIGSKSMKRPTHNDLLGKNRRTHNDAILRRMRAGDPLWSYDSQSSWFPPRPTIKKDQDLIKKLYRSPAKSDLHKEAEGKLKSPKAPVITIAKE